MSTITWPGYNSELERLTSFEMWPMETIDCGILACMGMYYQGVGTIAQCQFCDVSIGSWSFDRSPVNIHMEKSPNCPLLRCEFTENIPLDFLTLHLLLPGCKEFIGNEDLCIESVRFETFADCNATPQSQALSLARAGFFYDGGIFVRCFCCGVCFEKTVLDEDPWSAHTKWNTNCRYLKLLKAKAFDQDLVGSTAESMTDQQTTSTNSTQASVLAICQTVKDIELTAGNECSHDNNCIICVTGKKDVAFIPCGHVVGCLNCTKRLKFCPVCRMDIERTQFLYFC